MREGACVRLSKLIMFWSLYISQMRCQEKENQTEPWAGIARLVGVTSWTPKGHWLDSSQGTYLDCGFGPWLGHVQEATN